MKITGIMFYYYFVCKRKLWCFLKGIQLENSSENVMLGKLLDESSYSRERKHILIDEAVNVDFMDDWKVIHEIKKSKSIEEASIWQVKYYLYFLNKRGIEVEKGILDFPLLKERRHIVLEDGDIEKIEQIVDEIRQMKERKTPDIINTKICKKCAYYEYCYI
jgi:CRISPR-associated exonuclease Cas4